MTEGEEAEIQIDPYDYTVEKENQKLNIFYVYINGLNEHKIQHSDLLKDSKGADIICFTETHFRDDVECPIIENYKAYHTILNRTKFLGRNIKSTSLYCNDALFGTEIKQVISERGNLIILKLTNNNRSEIGELFIIVCYKEDRESKFKTKNYFENIKRHKMDLKMKHVITIGGLNGRIGTLNDNDINKLTIVT